MADGGQITNSKATVQAVIEVALVELVSFNELRKRVVYAIKTLGGTSHTINRDNNVIVVYGELYGEPFCLTVAETTMYQEQVKVSTW